MSLHHGAPESGRIFEFLRKVPLFAGLPEADLKHLCEMVEEVTLAPRDKLFAEGDLGDQAYVIMEGQLEILKASGGKDVLLAVREPGEVIGEMALLEEAPRMASTRARTDMVLLPIRKEQLDHMLDNSPSAGRAMLGTIVGWLRNTESLLRQSERMAQLGTLTAGVAHELNNPAAAVQRGASQAQEAMTRLEQSQVDLGRLALTGEAQESLAGLATRVQERAGRPAELDALARSDREYELEGWLEDRGVDSAWELAPTLVDLGFDEADLDSLGESFDGTRLSPVVRWLSARHAVGTVLAEVGQGAGRISEIVKALKTYSYLDQAPVQNVDLHEGLDNTLLILRSKLESAISVKRDYAEDLPRIQAYGSELNQVWTNLIDNAADALDGRGQITIRTRRNGESVVVEIEDNGSGIPLEIQSRIFDSFFTTKPPGKGTGLGLDITYNIVVDKHRGDIKLFSEPGKTTFQVWLPVNFEAEA